MKMQDDEQLEKLFEGMSREAAREIANQNSPKRREPIKKTKKEKLETSPTFNKNQHRIKLPKKGG